MHPVCLLRGEKHPHERYVGLTTDLKARLAKHNEGSVPSTAQHKPWSLQTYVAFQDPRQAGRFERYLKSGSGRAFTNRHLWP